MLFASKGRGLRSGSRAAGPRAARTVASAVATIALGTQSALGVEIIPVRAIASTYYSSSQQPLNLVNSTLLDVTLPDVASQRQQVDGSANGMWHGGTNQGVTQGTAPVVASTFVVLDLGANYDLTTANLWQFAQVGQTTRGVRSFSILTSSAVPDRSAYLSPQTTFNTSSFTEVLSSAQLTQAVSGVAVAPQSFTLNSALNVRQVFIRVNSAWSGAANEYVGLSKVKFDGARVTGTTLLESSPNFTQQFPLTTSNTDITLDRNTTRTLTSTFYAQAYRTLNVTAGNVTFATSNNINSWGGDAVNVTSGASATINNLYMGLFSTDPNFVADQPYGGFSANTINVSGAGSTLVVPAVTNNSANGGYLSSSTSIGLGAINARVNVSAGGTATFAGEVRVGERNGSGLVTVAGPGSRLAVTSANGLFLGYGNLLGNASTLGTGVMAVTDGATVSVSNRLSVGAFGGRGELYVGRSDGSDTATANVNVAAVSVGVNNSLSQGVVTVYPRGVLAVASDFSGITGTINVAVNGGTLTAGGIFADAGTYVVSGGGSVTSSGDLRSAGTFTVNAGRASAVTLRVTGGAFNVNTGGTVAASGAALVTAGTLTVAGGRVSAGANSTVSASGNIVVSPGGVFDLTGFTLSSAGSATAGNRLTVAGGTLLLSSLTATATNSAQSQRAFAWTSGTLAFTGAASTSLVYGQGTQSFNITVPTGGLLAGSTTLTRNDLVVNGTLSPGLRSAPIGTFNTRALTITGGTYQTDVDLAAAAADILNVTGTVTLNTGSTLDVSLLNLPASPGFASYTYLLVANDGTEAVTGTFANVRLNTPAGWTYTLNYAFTGPALNGTGTGNDIAITVSIPEPAAVGLVLPAAVMLPRRRREARFRPE